MIPDTRNEKEWQTFEGHKQFRSWLCVPLVASDELLGFLSVGHLEPNHFTEDHLRRAELLAIPAAAALQNARLYSTAEIYGSELEKRLADLEKAEQALDQSQAQRRASEEKFQNVFPSSPIAFSITTLEEGRFLEVNAALKTLTDIAGKRCWGAPCTSSGYGTTPADRRLLLTQLHRAGPIRTVTTRHRAKSGEVKLTAYSADPIQFEGRTCVLAVSEDVVSMTPSAAIDDHATSQCSLPGWHLSDTRSHFVFLLSRISGLRLQTLFVRAEVLQMAMTYLPVIALVYREALRTSSPAGLLLLAYLAVSIPFLGQQLASIAWDLPGLRNT